MINILDIAAKPNDYDTMITRKVQSAKNSLEGVVLNKKSHKAYNVTIKFDTPQLQKDSLVSVYCNCDDFKYRWAYPLFEKDALLNVRNFQLTPPEKTNPKGELNACKHIHAFAYAELQNALKVFSNKKNSI